MFYTTGRLTSEMVIKAAQMGIPIVVSRSGITQMGLEVAQRLDLCAIGRATNKRFLCFSAAQRLQLRLQRTRALVAGSQRLPGHAGQVGDDEAEAEQVEEDREEDRPEGGLADHARASPARGSRGGGRASRRA